MTDPCANHNTNNCDGTCPGCPFPLRVPPTWKVEPLHRWVSGSSSRGYYVRCEVCGRGPGSGEQCVSRADPQRDAANNPTDPRD